MEKKLFAILVAMTFAFVAQAETEPEDVVEKLRTLSCQGSLVDQNQTSVTVDIVVSDYKITYTEGETTFVDYTSELQITNPANTKKKFYGVITSYDISEDPHTQRNEKRDGGWAGLTFYNIYKNKKAADKGEFDREGLVIFASKESITRGFQRKYDLAVNLGELNDPKTKSYAGPVTCTISVATKD